MKESPENYHTPEKFKEKRLETKKVLKKVLDEERPIGIDSPNTFKEIEDYKDIGKRVLAELEGTPLEEKELSMSYNSEEVEPTEMRAEFEADNSIVQMIEKSKRYSNYDKESKDLAKRIKLLQKQSEEFHNFIEADNFLQKSGLVDTYKETLINIQKEATDLELEQEKTDKDFCKSLLFSLLETQK